MQGRVRRALYGMSARHTGRTRTQDSLAEGTANHLTGVLPMGRDWGEGLKGAFGVSHYILLHASIFMVNTQNFCN